MHLHIIPKDIAKSLGMKFFFTGIPCSKGGVGLRFVSTNRCRCSVCLNRHREQEREKIENGTRVRVLTPEQKEQKRIKNKERNHNPLTKLAVRLRKSKNREKINEQKRAYHKKYPHIARAKRSLRRAILKNRTPKWFSELDRFVVFEAAHLCELRKSATGFEWQVDHMFPLQGDYVSGLHCALNLQVIPSYLNTSKSNKMIFTESFEWMSFKFNY